MSLGQAVSSRTARTSARKPAKPRPTAFLSSAARSRPACSTAPLPEPTGKRGNCQTNHEGPDKWRSEAPFAPRDRGQAVAQRLPPKTTATWLVLFGTARRKSRKWWCGTQPTFQPGQFAALPCRITLPHYLAAARAEWVARDLGERWALGARVVTRFLSTYRLMALAGSAPH